MNQLDYPAFYRWYWQNYPAAFVRDVLVTLVMLPIWFIKGKL